MRPKFLNRWFRSGIVHLSRWKNRKHFSDDPIIICGCGRSGTTLLLAILDAHPHIFGIDEMHMFSNFGSTGPVLNTTRKPRKLHRLYGHILQRSIPRTTTRYCGKRPACVRDIARILDYFDGRVRIIHLVRDGRDVCTSRHPSRPEDYWVPIKRWVNDVEAGLAYEKHPRVYTLRYEDLVDQPTKTIKKVLDFLNEPMTESVLNWEDTTSFKKADAWFGNIQKVHKNSLRKWEKPEHRKRVEEIMADERATALLRRLDYVD